MQCVTLAGRQLAMYWSAPHTGPASRQPVAASLVVRSCQQDSRSRPWTHLCAETGHATYSGAGCGCVCGFCGSCCCSRLWRICGCPCPCPCPGLWSWSHTCAGYMIDLYSAHASSHSLSQVPAHISSHSRDTGRAHACSSHSAQLTQQEHMPRFSMQQRDLHSLAAAARVRSSP